MSYLPKVLSSEPHKVNSLLVETITMLCRNGLSFTKRLKIEGMIAITVDDSEIALIHLNEFLYPNPSSPNPMQQCSKNKSSLVLNKSNPDGVGCTDFNGTVNAFSVDNPCGAIGSFKNGNKEFIVESPFLFNSESPSDEDEKPEKVEANVMEEQLSDCLGMKQILGPSETRQCYDVHPSNYNEKSDMSEKTHLVGNNHIKCETIDITDEEECDNGSNFDGRNGGRYDTSEGLFGNSNNCQMVDSLHQRGINSTRSFVGREPAPNDAFNHKSSDDFLVSLNIDEQASVSEHLPRLREDVGWQGHSRYAGSMADNDYDATYQFIPRKRMVGSIDNRPYACPVEGCDRRFFHRNNVYRHRKQKHPLEVSFKT